MLRIVVPKSLEREFRAAARAAYPNETIAFVLGTVAGDTVYLEELYFPHDSAKYCTATSVNTQSHWLVDAKELAKENELAVVGDIHSHPISEETFSDHSPSEIDIDGQLLVVNGICRIHKNGQRLRATIRWWGPMVKVEVKKV